MHGKKAAGGLKDTPSPGMAAPTSDTALTQRTLSVDLLDSSDDDDFDRPAAPPRLQAAHDDDSDDDFDFAQPVPAPAARAAAAAPPTRKAAAVAISEDESDGFEDAASADEDNAVEMSDSSDEEEAADAVGALELKHGTDQFELPGKLHGMLYNHQVRPIRLLTLTRGAPSWDDLPASRIGDEPARCCKFTQRVRTAITLTSLARYRWRA